MRAGPSGDDGLMGRAGAGKSCDALVRRRWCDELVPTWELAVEVLEKEAVPRQSSSGQMCAAASLILMHIMRETNCLASPL